MMLVRWWCSVVGFVMVRGVVVWCSDVVCWCCGGWGRGVCFFGVKFVWCGGSGVVVHIVGVVRCSQLVV